MLIVGTGKYCSSVVPLSLIATTEAAQKELVMTTASAMCTSLHLLLTHGAKVTTLSSRKLKSILEHFGLDNKSWRQKRAGKLDWEGPQQNLQSCKGQSVRLASSCLIITLPASRRAENSVEESELGVSFRAF